VLLKTGNILTQYYVNEIQVDSQKRQVSLILRSIMSGKKIQHYKLDQVSSELVNNVGVIKYFSSSFTLKLIMDQNGTYFITDRYGFTLETLSLTDTTLKSIKAN
jgi:hypothetical protein